MPESAASTVVAIELPTGGRLVASPTLQRHQADCSAAANLQAQIAPWIAAMSCQFRILNLLKPLIEIVKGLPTPPAQAVVEFLKTAEDLVPCMAAPSKAAVLPFVRDLLCVVIQSLKCLQHDLQAMATLASTDPSAVSTSEVQSVLDSYQPIVGLLELAGGIFGMAGIPAPQAPQLGQGTDAASLNADQAAIADFIAALQVTADALGGCR